jgi:hypothetical protein
MLLQVLPLVLALSGQVAAQQAPPPVTSPPAQVAPAQVQTAPRTPPPPYNEKLDAKAAIETAIHGAATDDIRVLINWGANDDPGSKAFAKVRSAPEIARSEPSFFSDEYKVVNVNVGHLDANVDLAKSYGVTLSADALPALTLLDAKGKVIANTTAAALRPENDPAGIDAPKLAAFLKSHQAPPPNDTAKFEAAVKQAKKADKTVFVWFSAPW